MIKQQLEVNLANGPPGYVVRKSRDALWKFDVRGDPPLIETGNLTGFNNLSGLNPVMALLIFSKIAGCNRPDGRGMPGRMMNDEGRMMNDRNAEGITKWGLKPKCSCNQDPLPEGNGKGYRPYEYGIDLLQKQYPLPSALADGSRSGNVVISQKMVITNCIEILKQVQDDKEKDCVRLDNFPEGTHIQLGKQGFHRAQSVIPFVGSGHVLTDEGRMMNDRNAVDTIKLGLKPKFGGIPNPLPEGNGKGYSSDRNCCIVQKSYPLPSALADGLEEATTFQQMGFKNNEKDCVRVDDYPEGYPVQPGGLGFHRARRVMSRRMMNGE